MYEFLSNWLMNRNSFREDDSLTCKNQQKKATTQEHSGK